MIRVNTNNQHYKLDSHELDSLAEQAVLKDALSSYMNKENISHNFNESQQPHGNEKLGKNNSNSERFFSIPKLENQENFEKPTKRKVIDLAEPTQSKENIEMNQQQPLKLGDLKSIEVLYNNNAKIGNKHSSSFIQPANSSRTSLGYLSKQNQFLKNQHDKLSKQNHHQSIFDNFSKKEALKQFPNNMDKNIQHNIQERQLKFSKNQEIGINSTRYGIKQNGHILEKNKNKNQIQTNKSLLDFKQEVTKNCKLENQTSLPLDQIIEDEPMKQVVSKSTSYLPLMMSQPEVNTKLKAPTNLASALKNIKLDSVKTDIMQNNEEPDYVGTPYRDLESNKISKYYAIDIQNNLKKNDEKVNSRYSLQKHNIPANLRAKMVD